MGSVNQPPFSGPHVCMPEACLPTVERLMRFDRQSEELHYLGESLVYGGLSLAYDGVSHVPKPRHQL